MRGLADMCGDIHKTDIKSWSLHGSSVLKNAVGQVNRLA
jgi:hypothetical protein